MKCCVCGRDFNECETVDVVMDGNTVTLKYLYGAKAMYIKETMCSTSCAEIASLAGNRQHMIDSAPRMSEDGVITFPLSLDAYSYRELMGR